MWPLRTEQINRISGQLQTFSDNIRPLPGISTKAARDTLALQMVASLRRLDYTTAIRTRPIDARRIDPNDSMFDPERAAALHAGTGDLDEAVWLIFLATHFGKHATHGWKRLKDVYSGLGVQTWTWQRVSNNPASFRNWLTANWRQIGGAFGNHRKYETLDPNSRNNSATVVESYIDWIGPARSHGAKFASLVHQGGNDPHSIFDHFYADMQVMRFGRLGKFDFLALIGRMDFAPIKPGQAYLASATGPLTGARLLFENMAGPRLSAKVLEEYLRELDDSLDVGMQVLEDSLCNWQKSPEQFIHFKG